MLIAASVVLVSAGVWNDEKRVKAVASDMTWTSRTVPANGWKSVAYGNGMWVAVANSGTNRVMSSTDGINWTPALSANESTAWNAVAYGNGRWVAVGSSSTNRTMTSTDGLNWTSNPSANDALLWMSLAYGNGVWVAVALATGGNNVMTSTDGISWTLRAPTNNSSHWGSVAFGQGKFVAVTSSGSSVNQVMSSTDGETWQSVNASVSGGWSSIAYGNNVWVAADSGGTSSRIMTSPDGTTWTTRSTGSSNRWAVAGAGNNLWIVMRGAAGGWGASASDSPTGTWVQQTGVSNTTSWNSVAYGEGMWVAVANSTLITSGSMLGAPLNPTFSSPVGTSDGFTVNITNYDPAYTFSPTVSAGSVSVGSASGSTLPVTVSGLSASASATLTVATSRAGYQNGTASVAGTANAATTTTSTTSTTTSTTSTSSSSTTTTVPASTTTATVAPASRPSADTSAGNRPVLSAPVSPVPKVVSPQQLEVLSRPAGQAVASVDGKVTPVAITRTNPETGSVAPAERSPAAIADLRRQGRTVLDSIRTAVPASTNLGMSVVDTKVGAVIRGAAVDPRDGKTPLDIPVEDVLVVGAGSVKMMVVGVDTRGGAAKVQRNGVLNVGRGGFVSLTAAGMTPGAAGEIIVMSTPRVLSSFTVASDGTFSGQVKLPSDLEGNHTVVLATSSVSVSLGVEISESATIESASGGSAMPQTGSNSIPLTTLGLFLLALGLTFLQIRHLKNA